MFRLVKTFKGAQLLIEEKKLELLLSKEKFLLIFVIVEIVSFAPYSALMSANGEPKLKRVKLSLFSPTNDETLVRNVFCAVKFKRKYKKKPQADSKLGKISFLVEGENPEQYFDHLQLREVLLKLLPFQTFLLLFEKRNSEGICKIHIIFLAKTDPNESSVRLMFEKPQKEVLADKINIYYKYINLYSPLTYVKTMKRSLYLCENNEEIYFWLVIVDVINISFPIKI